MNYGVILARFQPIHNGHIELIKKACNQHDTVLILVGSADKLNERNPIPIDFRLQMITESLKEHNLLQQCRVIPLDDLSSESDNSYEWGFYLYAKITDILKDSLFTMYYSDGFEIITRWFPPVIMRYYVSLSLLSRGSIASGVSATLVREYIKSNNAKLEDSVPLFVYQNRKLIETFIDLAKK